LWKSERLRILPQFPNDRIDGNPVRRMIRSGVRVLNSLH